ncbi:FAD-dependent oxidoreductase [Opitutaceae bacterium TAV4]|nr:FAD-dependent oxidoreductase [Opitutaceae bacterium TAV4]RRJ98920.1 FAD-dependent oxidoreductase [Opitutaceae bacterium TAV3]
MKPILQVSLFSLLALSVPLSADTYSADICIYGGTSAGVIAAVQSASMGKSVVLLEPGRHLGGMTSEGLGITDIDNHRDFQNSPAVGGLALEFYRRISTEYNRLDQFEEMLRSGSKIHSLWCFEPSVAERVFNKWIAETRVKVLRDSRLADANPVTKNGSVIQILRTAGGDTISARVFIDATYEGDLLAAAGVSTVTGREGNARYGETLNGIRNPAQPFTGRKIDPYIIPGDPSSGLIYGVSDEAPGRHGDPSDAIQAYAFRNSFTRNPGNRIPFAKPENYGPAHYELQRRLLAAGVKPGIPGAVLPNGKSASGNWGQLSGNLLNWNHDYPNATHAERQKMIRHSLDYIKGLCWFLANDPGVPEHFRAEWSRWGTCKDEYTDNGGWPRVFYIRNGRRMVSDFVITQWHGSKTNTQPVEDPVALVWWPHDLHSPRRIVKEGCIWNEGAVFGGKNWIPFGVPYRSLYPKPSESTNLLTPTCPSSSYVAYGAYRIEFTFMAAAQATATAAAMAVDDNLAVQDVPYPKLRDRLLKDKQVIEAPK